MKFASTCGNCHMWGEARWEGRKENWGLQISSLSLSLSASCVFLTSGNFPSFPEEMKNNLLVVLTVCIWVSCHDRMRSWIKGLLGSDWIWEFCELLWSLTHYTHCHLRLSLKIPNPLCPWIKIRKNYWEQNKPLPCGVVHEERSEWLSKMDHQQERDWWGETRSGASSIQ